MRLLLFTVMFCLGLQHSFVAVSQDSKLSNLPLESDEFVSNRVFSFGLGTVRKQYDFLSHINYSGTSLNFNLHHFEQTKTGLFTSNFSGLLAQLTHAESSSYLTSFGLAYDYAYNHHIAKLFGEVDFFLGASLDADANFNYLPINTNNPVAFIFANNLSLSHVFRYQTQWDEFKFYFTNHNFLNTIGFTLFAPEYAFPTPYYYYESEQEDFSSSLNFIHLGNYFRLVNRFSVDIKSGYIADYTLRLAYRFQGLNATLNQNDYRDAAHAFTIGLVYKMFKY